VPEPERTGYQFGAFIWRISARYFSKYKGDCICCICTGLRRSWFQKNIPLWM